MYEVGVVSQFEAAHSLTGEFGPATRTHGHTYRVEITVGGERLKEDGTLCDMGWLQELAQNVIGELHFQNLDDLQQFSGRNSTAEVVAQHIFDWLLPSLRQNGLRSLSVTIWESPQAFARVKRNL